MISVSSSNVHSIGYNSEKCLLTVRFLNGTQYQFEGVPESVYREFMGASSAGSYFAKHIRGRFPVAKVKDEK